LFYDDIVRTRIRWNNAK